MEPLRVFNAVYTHLNRTRFNGELPPLPITTVTGKRYLACLRAVNGAPVEIMLSIDNIPQHDPGETVAAAILHEMIHEYCLLHGIPHYNTETGEHTPEFVREAEKRGLFYDDFLSTNFLLDDFFTH